MHFRGNDNCRIARVERAAEEISRFRDETIFVFIEMNEMLIAAKAIGDIVLL
jgi:hypothetical protein